PRDLETVCLKCLEKQPERRYASALELADDLGRFLDGKPIHARPVGLFERLRRLVVRRPFPVALGGLLAGAVVALATGWLWHHRRVDDLETTIRSTEAESAEARALAAVREFHSHLHAIRERNVRAATMPQPGWTWANEEAIARALALPATPD